MIDFAATSPYLNLAVLIACLLAVRYFMQRQRAKRAQERAESRRVEATRRALKRRATLYEALHDAERFERACGVLSRANGDTERGVLWWSGETDEFAFVPHDDVFERLQSAPHTKSLVNGPLRTLLNTYVPHQTMIIVYERAVDSYALALAVQKYAKEEGEEGEEEEEGGEGEEEEEKKER